MFSFLFSPGNKKGHYNFDDNSQAEKRLDNFLPLRIIIKAITAFNDVCLYCFVFHFYGVVQKPY
jgi:hypothetical protein